LSSGITPEMIKIISDTHKTDIREVFLLEKFGLYFSPREKIIPPARNSHNLDGSI